MSLSKKLGVLDSIREESTMSQATQNAVESVLDRQVREKFTELASMLSVQKYGVDGPPKNLTFREIEQAGYEAAQLVAAQFETTVATEHQQHFSGAQPCPQCNVACEAEDLAQRRILTRLGPVDLSEIKFHCNACKRSFFPSA